MDYSKHIGSTQKERLDGRQVKNNQGGYVYEVAPLERLRRFLILGTEGGTYYVGERELTKETTASIISAIQTLPRQCLEEIISISDQGRAPKNDPAIFALALVCTYADNDTKQAAYKAITKVCRTGTHLFHFVQAIQNLRGWSAGLRKGVAAYYEGDIERVANQLIKYRQRDGWTHRDVLRLCHAQPLTITHGSVFRHTVGKDVPQHTLPMQMYAFEVLKSNPTEKNAISAIAEHQLPREAIPTELLNSPKVWEALLEHMPMTAMIRNLGKMAAVKLTKTNLDAASKKISEKLKDAEALKKSRVHPLMILNALKTYSTGHGDKGSLSWTPVPSIVGALDRAFYLAFGNVEKTGKNFFLGLDVSGSMNMGRIAGMNITPREATAAVAVINAHTDPCVSAAFSHQLVNFPLHEGEPISTVLSRMDAMPFGGTDCSLPMITAMQQKLPIDCFVIYTDNETAHGKVHPKVALETYRQKMGRDAKLVVVGMTATKFTIADPKDRGMLDVVGFDTATPQIISDFALSRF